jgi:hypothetical protein
LCLDNYTFALFKQYQSAQSASSLLDLLPRLAILSVASETKNADFPSQTVPRVYVRQRSLETTLFKPVAIADLQGLIALQSGSRNKGCICLFGVQLETAFNSGLIDVSDVTHLTIGEEPGSWRMRKMG